MRIITTLVFTSLTLALQPGCALKEIRGKSKFGTEYRHSGAKRTNKERWSVQQGFEFKWDRGFSTGLSYRRRDDNGGGGDNDNGVFFDFSFPLWKAKPQPDKSEARIRNLERRLAALEKELPSAADRDAPATPGDDQGTAPRPRSGSAEPAD